VIRFKVNRWDERALARRLSAIVQGNSHVYTYDPAVTCQVSSTGWKPEPDKNGLPPHPRRWTLDDGNNIWLNPEEGAPGVYLFDVRRWSAENEAAFAVVLKWLLHAEILGVGAEVT